MLHSMGALPGIQAIQPLSISCDGTVVIGQTEDSNRYFVWDDGLGIRDLPQYDGN